MGWGEPFLENKYVDWVDKSKRKSHQRTFSDVLTSRVYFEKPDLLLNAGSSASATTVEIYLFAARDSCNPLICNKIIEISKGFSFCKYFNSAQVSSRPSAQR